MKEDLTRTQEVRPLQVRADFDVKTLNIQERTVELVFATNNSVRMAQWDWNEGIVYYDEILAMKPENVRMERLRAGAPLLNNHDSWDGVDGVLGVVVSASVDGKAGRATVRFSKRADVEPVWQDVVDGILRGVSVGYRVYEYQIKEREGEIDEYTATDWEPFEISLAPIPADIASGVRTAERADKPIATNKVKIRSLNGPLPTKRTQTMEETAAEKEARLAKEAAENTRKENERNAAIAAGQKEAKAAEKKRALEIRTAVKAAKLSDDFAIKLIEEDKTIDEARALIIEEFAKGDESHARSTPPGPRITVGIEDRTKRMDGMIEAIEQRSQPSNRELAAKAAKSEYRGMSLIRMAQECVEVAGGRSRGMSDREIAMFAMNGGNSFQRDAVGMMATSDFPNILANTVNRRLLAEYQLAPRTYQQWMNRNDAKDFRPQVVTRLGDATGMNLIEEGGMYKYGSMGEAAEQYAVNKYGEIISITWEALINDDLSAFTRIPKKIANTAARKQSDLVYAMVVANANMSDGNAWFSGAHGNLGTTAAISIASLGEARQFMRQQKGVGALDYLNLTPAFLLVGPQIESLALQYTSADYLPNTQSQVNPYKNLSIIVEPRLTGLQWYVIADPNSIDTAEYAFLQGQGEIYTETRQGFDQDGLEMKARMVFGTKSIDWRGIYKNVGA